MVSTTNLVVAVLFTDVVGSTETGSRLGHDRAGELRRAHFDLLRQAISRHAGTEVKNLGDGLMVVFAAASDAVACAVDMQQAVERHNRRMAESLSMRVGLAVGEASREDGDYFGAPVIEASRLCARASPGQVLVTELARLLAGSRGDHRFEPLGPVTLKGLPEPVSVHDVRWQPTGDAAPALPLRLSIDRSAAFIGRDAERQVLERAWKRAGEGTIQVVLIGGEPGIGKTRLATEMALGAHDDGGAVLLGVCDEDLALPYQPFVDALRHLLSVCPDDEVSPVLAARGGELARLLPELLRRNPPVPPPQEADPDTERYLLFGAVASLLEAASGWRPILLVLDDLHWVTKPTLLLLKYLIRSGPPMRLLVVGTYRDSDIGRGHPLTDLLADLRRQGGVERLGLRGLSDAEALSLMENLAGHELAGSELELVHAVHAEADGSPFFMRELLRHFIETGELVQVADRWKFRGETAGIPDSVREVIGYRLSRLCPPADRLLTLAAVIGREFDVAVLAPLAGLDRATVVDALDDARQAALIREVAGSPGRYSFVHALIRHTIYDELGPARRVELHRRVGETLESLGADDDLLSDLAHHWVAATPAARVPVDDLAKAAHYAERAARRAMGSLAYEEAAGHFDGALRAARQAQDPGYLAELLIGLGEAQRCAGDPTHRETLLEAGRIAHEHGDIDRAARAALANQRGTFSLLGAVDADRVAALEQALEAEGRASTSVRAALLASLATELHFESGERRLAVAREAVDIARRSGDEETLARALAALWFAAWGSTVHDERSSIAIELHEVAARLGDRTVQFHAGAALFLSATGSGDMALADRALAGCIEIAEALGQPIFAWRAAYLRTHRAMAAGRYDEAERWADESLRLGEMAGQADRIAHSSLHELRMLQGRFAEAEELIRNAMAQLPDVGVFDAYLAWSLVGQGKTGEAHAILDDLRTRGFTDIPRDYTRLVRLAALSRTCAYLDDRASAAALYELLWPARTVMTTGQTAWLGPVAHDLGLLSSVLGNYEQAEQHFVEALQVQDRIGARATGIHTRLEWARMLTRRRDPDDETRARSLLEAAKAEAEEVDLPAIVGRIDELLGQLDS